MATKVNTRKQNKTLGAVLKELRDIKNKLGKFLVLIPEENLKDYKNSTQIKKAFSRALKKFPPK